MKTFNHFTKNSKITINLYYPAVLFSGLVLVELNADLNGL